MYLKFKVFAQEIQSTIHLLTFKNFKKDAVRNPEKCKMM